jgi:hypothetical protein
MRQLVGISSDGDLNDDGVRSGFSRNAAISHHAITIRRLWIPRRAELFVNGFGLFGNGPSGNAINQQETQSGRVSVGYRFHLNAVSALEGRYGLSRDSQKYTIGGTGGTASSVPAFLSEISTSYVFGRDLSLLGRS